MRNINKIITHCADTYPSMDIGAHEIRRWHLDRGWSDIGYHFVIRRDGKVEEGRPVYRMGAHCRGHNHDSIGICLVGGKQPGTGKAENNFTEEQFESLRDILGKFKKDYPEAKIYGHREFDSGKECPSFDIQDWLRCNFIGD